MAAEPREETRPSAGNDGVRVTFQRDGEGVRLAELTHVATGRQYLAPGGDGALWRLELHGRGRQPVTVTSAGARAEATTRRRGARGTEVELRWPSVDLPGETDALEVTATVRVPRGSGAPEWRLSVANRSAAYGLWSVQFPCLRLAAPPDAVAVTPWGWGRQFVDPVRTCRYEGRYPSHNAVLQMAALHLGPEGLYLAAQDPRAEQKELVLRGEDGALSFWITSYPVPLARPGAPYRQGYPVVTAPYRGDWSEAALRYRDWALKAPWMREGPESRRRSTPRWLKEVALWCQTGGPPEQVVPRTLAFARYFGVPTALHWYNWHQIPFDDHYPEYFPPKPGFAEGVKELQRAGVRVMPYINGRIVDARTETWKQDSLARYTAKDEAGKDYVETYGSGVPLTVMCPATPYWQGKVAGIVGRLVGDYGVDGVYIDQVASAPARPCLDPTHSHPPGGGDVWARGYREMLTKVRRELRARHPNAMLTTEDAAESWSDQLDAFLMCNSTTGDLVPLYPLVYGGRTLVFGRYFFDEDYRTPGAFATKAAQMFLWGAQMGWLDPGVLDHPTEAAYLRELARARHAANRFLALGQMLPGLRLSAEPMPQVETTWRLWGAEFPLRMPAVGGSLWRSPSGELGVVLTNCSNQAVTIRWSLEGEQAGAGRRWRLRDLGDPADKQVELRGEPAGSQDMAPYSARVLALRPG